MHMLFCVLMCIYVCMCICTLYDTLGATKSLALGTPFPCLKSNNCLPSSPACRERCSLRQQPTCSRVYGGGSPLKPHPTLPSATPGAKWCTRKGARVHGGAGRLHILVALDVCTLSSPRRRYGVRLDRLGVHRLSC